MESAHASDRGRLNAGVSSTWVHFCVPRIIAHVCPEGFRQPQIKISTQIIRDHNPGQIERRPAEDAWPCSYERHVCEKLGFPLQESDVNRIHVALLRRDPRSKSGNQLESRAIAMVAACAVTPSYGASRHRSRTEICVFLHVHVTCVVA